MHYGAARYRLQLLRLSHAREMAIRCSADRVAAEERESLNYRLVEDAPEVVAEELD